MSLQLDFTVEIIKGLMYVFIDESGIHNQQGVSSVVLVCISIDNLDKIQSSVVDLERKLKISSFHWSKSTWNRRENFIKEIAKENFSIKAAL
ncbi:MAG: hypothetical protein KGJ35_01590, partial [Patescibacteria group bacterium]|nr:hypothetical protein [Patescibacteria group bacterium]